MATKNFFFGVSKLFFGVCKPFFSITKFHSSITSAIRSIKPDFLKRVFLNIPKRLNLVIQNNDGHIEQYL